MPVLYRKYRPQSFAEVVGQEHVIKTLTNAIVSGMISHAYLFWGKRGSGKTTIARLLAKAVNCENRKSGEFESCEKCSSCLEIKEGRSMDLIEIDAASHTGVDEIRDLIGGIKFVPVKSKYKVFILDETHQLSKGATSALLKTLEEPPGHAIFVLATTEPHKILPTIISRCQHFGFRKLTVPEIFKRLEIICQKEKVKVEKTALNLIALNSGGSIRDAESLLDQMLTFATKDQEIKVEDVKDLLGLVEIALVSQFCDFLFQKKAKEAIDFLNQTADRGLDLQEFVRSLINYLRQGLLLKVGGFTEQGLTKEEIEKLSLQVANLKETDFQKIIELFLDAQNKMKYSSIPQLPLELAIVEYCRVV